MFYLNHFIQTFNLSSGEALERLTDSSCKSKNVSIITHHEQLRLIVLGCLDGKGGLVGGF